MRRLTAVLALAAAFLLTGCTASGIAEFDREQLASDKLDLPARYEDAGFDENSIRWLAERDGVDFYAAQSGAGACLIMVKDGDTEGSMAGCTQTELTVEGVGFPSARLYIDHAPPGVPDGMTQLTPNLYVAE
jgi:hypothetical protein